MPHYKDGTPAEIGDIVKGKPYNTNHEVVGEMLQITPNTDSCNCIVAFLEKRVISGEQMKVLFDVGLSDKIRYTSRPIGGIVKSDIETEYVELIPRYDYGAIKDFIKIG